MSKQKQRRSIFNSSQVHTSSTVEWGAVGGGKKGFWTFCCFIGMKKSRWVLEERDTGWVKESGSLCLQPSPNHLSADVSRRNHKQNKYTRKKNTNKWRSSSGRSLAGTFLLNIYIFVRVYHATSTSSISTQVMQNNLARPLEWLKVNRSKKQEATSSRTRTWDVQHVRVWPLSCLCKPEHNLYVSPDTWLLFSEKEWRNNRTGQGGRELEPWIRLDCHIRNRQTSNRRSTSRTLEVILTGANSQYL